MTYKQSMQLFDIVNRNFKSEADARLFVEKIDVLISNSLKEEASDLATKGDLFSETAKINKEIAIIKAEMLIEIGKTNKEIANVKAEMLNEIGKTNKEITNVKADLLKEINNSKNNTIKRLFSFWATLLLLMVVNYFF